MGYKPVINQLANPNQPDFFSFLWDNHPTTIHEHWAGLVPRELTKMKTFEKVKDAAFVEGEMEQ